MRAHRPDLAVLDARLPGKSGLEVAVEIFREGLPTRVVLVTTRIDDRESLEALRLGIHGVLLKEVAPRLLAQCIRKVHAGGRWVELESLRRAVENLLREEAALSESTIKNHLHNIYVKLNLSRRGDLTRWYRAVAQPTGLSIARFEQIVQSSAAT